MSEYSVQIYSGWIAPCQLSQSIQHVTTNLAWSLSLHTFHSEFLAFGGSLSYVSLLVTPPPSHLHFPLAKAWTALWPEKIRVSLLTITLLIPALRSFSADSFLKDMFLQIPTGARHFIRIHVQWASRLRNCRRRKEKWEMDASIS